MSGAAQDGTRLADRLEIVALSDGFAHGLDHGDVDGFLELFTDDVVYVNGARRLNGKAELERFFRARAESGRISRHMYSGLCIVFAGPDAATGTSVWLTFAGDGPLPVESTVPFVVADISDDYRRADGKWLIARREISAVFVNRDIKPLPTTVQKP